MDTIFDSVSAKKNIPSKSVKEKFNEFTNLLMYILGCENNILIPGFGIFYVYNNSIFFSRTTILTTFENEYRTYFSYINTIDKWQLDNTKYNIAPYIINSNIKRDRMPWDDTIRTHHFDSDPIELSVLIEINRLLYYKNKDITIPKIGHLKSIKNCTNGIGFPIIKLSKCHKYIKKLNPKVIVWIPRFINIIKYKICQ